MIYRPDLKTWQKTDLCQDSSIDQNIYRSKDHKMIYGPVYKIIDRPDNRLIYKPDYRQI